MATGHYERKPITPWTVEEYKIVWKNRELSRKELSSLLPERTVKSVANHRLAFRKLTDEDIKFLENNRETMLCKDIDTERDLYKGTARKYFLMKGLRHMHRPNSYTKKEIETLKKHAGKKTYQEIADILGVDEPRIRNMASYEGIETKFVYTKELQESILQDIADGKTIKEVAESIGKTEDSVKIMLRNKGHWKYLEPSVHSIYHVNNTERYIMDAIEKEFGVKFPDKNPDTYDYYWGIIPPYEIDMPFEINGHKFAVEYDGEWWHKDKKDIDEIKTQMIIDKGYNFFRLSSWMHDHNKLETLNSVLEILFQSIRNIIRTKECSTTIESDSEKSQNTSE